jgi:carboxypeptidase C (cathepsin A)
MIRHWLLLFLIVPFSGGAQITADDFLVEGLDEIDPVFAKFDGKMHAGLISIDKDINAERGKLMFWLFDPEQPAVDDSFLIWFNGESL